jgi:hypothetical protein
MNASYTNWLFLAMVLLGLGLAAELYFAAGSGVPSAPAAAGNVTDTELPTASFALPELASLSDTVARPLFLPNRRVPEQGEDTTPEPAPTAGPPKANRFLLSAIVIIDDERIALLSDATTGSLSRVKEGERVSGWEVAEINDDSVVLVSGANREQLPLRTFGAPPPPSRKRAAPSRSAPGTQVVPGPAVPEAGARRPRRPRTGPRQAPSEQTQAY